MFFNLCQASIVGCVVMIRTEESAFGIHLSVWLFVLALLTYYTGRHYTDKASRLKRQEEKSKRK